MKYGEGVLNDIAAILDFEPRESPVLAVSGCRDVAKKIEDYFKRSQDTEL